MSKRRTCKIDLRAGHWVQSRPAWFSTASYTSPVASVLSFKKSSTLQFCFFSSRKMRVGWIWNCHQYENRQGHLMTFKVECPKERAWCPIIAQTWFKMSGEMSSFIWWISGCLLLESPCQTASQNMVEPQGRLGFLCFSLEDHSIQNTPSLLPGSCLHKKAGAQFRTNGLV